MIISDKKLKVIKCHHLTRCIPDQWEIQLEDKRQLYIRARWSHLSAKISEFPSEDNDDALDGAEVFYFPYDNYLDECGHLEIRRITKNHLDWSDLNQDTCQVDSCKGSG